MKHLLFGVLGALMLTAGAVRADLALVLSENAGDRRSLLNRGGNSAGQALRNAGFDVITGDVRSVEEMRSALSQMLSRIGDEERVVIYLAGRFVQGDGRAWMLRNRDGNLPDLATVDSVGLSVDTVLAVAGRLPGQAVVVLGRAGRTEGLGEGLTSGVGPIEVPQGVTVLLGTEEAAERFVREGVTQKGRRLADMTQGYPGLALRGFAGRVAFIPGDQARPIAPPDADEAERAIWQATQAQDTLEAYRGYLARYPRGLFAADAEAAIEAIQAEPFRAARQNEERLELDRNARRRIQRQLTLLGYQPRGVDGIFGAGTRAAIQRFQDRNGFPETGYLDQIQINRLSLQAESRRAQQEAEEARRRLEAERQDRAAWEATGAGSDEAGLRAYLNRFPDGIYSQQAKAQIAEIEREADRADWLEAQRIGTVGAFEAYLRRRPQGVFAAEAQRQIANLNRDRSRASETEALERAERALNLPRFALMLVERRLDQLGQRPGRIDGVLDDDARQAIWAFQRANSLPRTGYLDQATIASLLGDAAGLSGFFQGR